MLCIKTEFSLFANDKDQFESTVSKQSRACKRLMKVRVYRNLNRPDFYSILAMEGNLKGKVVGYAKAILLDKCRFVVGEKSRQRVLKERRRNVHAFCEGILLDASLHVEELNRSEVYSVTYNPYECGYFYRKHDGVAQTDDNLPVLLQGSCAYLEKVL